MDIMYYSFNISLLDICILILILFIIKMYKDSKKEKLDEKDDSCSFINILDENIKIDLLYLYKHEYTFRNINEFNRFISDDYIFKPINLFYIKNKIICIEIFNEFFNISLNGFSLYSSNKIDLNLLNFDKAIELINRELM